jgi:hypothetical protein
LRGSGLGSANLISLSQGRKVKYEVSVCDIVVCCVRVE